MTDPKYENMLDKYLDKAEDEKEEKKEESRNRRNSAHNPSPAARRFHPRPSYNPNFNNRNSPKTSARPFAVTDSPHGQYVEQKNESVKQTLERLFNEHKVMVNTKLDAITQMVNGFAEDVNKVKMQNKELQEVNKRLLGLLLEKKSTGKGTPHVTAEVPSTTEPPVNKASVMKSKPKRTVPLETAPPALKIRNLSTSSEEVEDECSGINTTKVVQGKTSDPPIPEFQRLLSLAGAKIVFAQDKFVCDKCELETIDCKDGDGIVLQECGHTFCKQCITEHVVENKNVNTVPCPFLNCEFPMLEGEIEALLTKAQLEDREETKLTNIRASMNLQRCATKGCAFMVDVGKGVFDFKCGLCEKVNCLDCKKIHSDGTTCRKLADLSEVEKWAKYEDWVAMNNDPIVANTQPFDCPVCFVDYGVGEGVVLKSCLHIFCRNCLKEHIASRIEEGDAIVKCPHGDGYSCSAPLQDREVKELLPRDVFDKYVEKSLKLAESNMKDKVHCLTPDCEYFCAIEDYPQFTCPRCEQLNCIPCKAIHTGKTCKQHHEDLLEKSGPEKQADIVASEAALNDLVAQGRAMICPNCGAHAVKETGCDAIVCRCKTELCWATKQRRWGPRGTGDITGGCKCKVNGIRCHPNCQNCH